MSWIFCYVSEMSRFLTIPVFKYTLSSTYASSHFHIQQPEVFIQSSASFTSNLESRSSCKLVFTGYLFLLIQFSSWKIHYLFIVVLCCDFHWIDPVVYLIQLCHILLFLLNSYLSIQMVFFWHLITASDKLSYFVTWYLSITVSLGTAKYR